jgi:hypothetical protein
MCSASLLRPPQVGLNMDAERVHLRQLIVARLGVMAGTVKAPNPHAAA